jgi:Domain of Unknown Function (DUF748)
MMRKIALWQKIVMAAGLVFGLYVLLGFFVLPPILKPWMENTLSGAVNRPVHLGSLEVNPLTLSLKARNVDIRKREGAGEFASAEEVFLDLEIGSMWQKSWAVEEIQVKGLKARISRGEDGSLNISDLLKSPAKPGASGSFAAHLDGLRLTIDEILMADRAEMMTHVLRGGTFTLQDIFLDSPEKKISVGSLSGSGGELKSVLLEWKKQPPGRINPGTGNPPPPPWELSLKQGELSGFDAKLEDRRGPGRGELSAGKIRVQVTGLSTEAQIRAHLVSSFLLNGGSVSAEGTVALQPVFADLRVDARKVPLPPLESLQSFSRDRVKVDITGGAFSASGNLTVKGSGQQGFQAGYKGSLSISDFASLGPEGMELASWKSLEAAGIDAGFNPFRISVGTVSLRSFEARLVLNPGGEINILKVLPASDRNITGDQPPERVPVRVEKAVLQDGRVLFTDRTLASPVTWKAENIQVTGENLSTGNTETGRLTGSLTLNEKGRISFEGSGGLNPVHAQMNLQLENVPLASAQPYVANRIRGTIAGGSLSGKGTFEVSIPSGEETKAKFSGKASVNDFLFMSEKDRELLKWKTLEANGIEAGYAPFSFKSSRVRLEDFFARAILDPEGNLNLLRVLRETPRDKAPAGKFSASLDELALQQGRIFFADLRTDPRYTAQLDDISGTISGLSTSGKKMAQVELKAMLNNRAPLEINGKARILGEPLYLELAASVKNLQVPGLSPYTSKFIGYTISKGQLSLEANYKVESRNLSGENKILLDNLSLGQEVNPEVVKVPLGLALSLLKNRYGEVHLRIPVSGSLNDPEFSLSSAIAKFLQNLLARIATSPLSFLGYLFGGGKEEDLSYVDFEPGNFAVSEPQKARLNVLAEALYERPALDLEIQGQADRPEDVAALKQRILERKLKRKKLNDMIAQGSPPVSLSKVQVEPGERERYLRELYREEVVALEEKEKTLPPAEMEKAILGGIEVSQAELDELASRRARNVEQFLLKTGKIEADRLFVLEPKVAEGKGDHSRVSLTVKS